MSDTNGHKSGAVASPMPKKLVVLPLRIFRVESGVRCHVRMLSERYGGLFTHFKGRSRICLGEGNCELHKSEKFWKGYCAAEVYQPGQDGGEWQPIVLEITEHLELDFRHQFQRGQVWELYRELVTGKGKPPVKGILWESHDLDTLPPPFDLVQPLRTLYHAEKISLNYPSPLPDRVLVSASKGPAPQATAPKNGEKILTAEEQKEFIKEFNERRKREGKRPVANPLG